MKATAQYLFEAAPDRQDGRRPRVSVGLVNNMPDAAMRAAERQFVTLLHAAAVDCDIRIHVFTLPSIGRSDTARDRIRARYTGIDRLAALHMDGLIVTGASPEAKTLSGAAFSSEFRDLVEWARLNTLSAIWSCLAAHAAVCHLDGIERRRLPQKLSGVFAVDTCRSDLPFAGSGPRYFCPHSRYHDLDEEDLRQAGYDILGRSDRIGVDMFARRTPSQFVFLQGHPEYDGDTLMREYRRDVSQFLAAGQGRFPDIPNDYFAAATAARLTGLPDIVATGAAAAIEAQVNAAESEVAVVGRWSSHAVRLMRSWICTIIEARGASDGSPSRLTG